MRKPALLSAIAFLMFLPLAANGQNVDSVSSHAPASVKPLKKPTSLSGEIGHEGKTLRADRDRRIWKVSNPEIFSGVDARHVRVKAQLDAAHGEIRILSVSEIGDERSGIKLDDAAFRR